MMRSKKRLKSLKSCGTYCLKIFETYFVSCKKNTADRNSNVKRTKQNSVILVSDCAICDNMTAKVH